MSDTFNWIGDMQRDLLRLMISDRDFYVRMMNLVKPNYFERKLYQDIARVLQQYFDKYHHPITPAILKQSISTIYENESNLEEAIQETGDICLADETLSKSKEHMEVETVRFAKQQAMKAAILQSVEALEKQDYAKIEDLVREALLVSPDVDLGEIYFSGIKDRYHREMAKEDTDRFTTGFESLDKELGGGMGKPGGLGKKELGMIYAPPGVGKSLWLVKVAAENLKLGRKVIYYSLEMSQDRIAARFDSVLSLVPTNQRVTQFPQMEKRLDEIGKRVGNNLIIKEFPTGAANTNDLRAHLMKLRNYLGFEPDLILLDYADLLQPNGGRGGELWQMQQRIYEEVRGLAVEGNYCIYTASQSNRKAREVAIITDNELGDSYGKLRVVDGAWSINKSMDESPRGLGRIYVVKHRNGATNYIVPIKFDYDTLRLKEISPEDYDLIMKGGLAE